MRAKYFKTMFHSVARGTIYSVGAADSECGQNWTAYYICAGQEGDPEDFCLEDRFFACREQVQMVVAGDSSDVTGRMLMDFVRENQVRQVILPGGQEEMAEALREAGAKRVVELKPGSSLYEEKDFWRFCIHCYGTEEECFLTMYSGPLEMDWRTMDCLMNVKPISEQQSCLAEIDMENHACCMRCSLYNDFDMCKGHNQNPGKGYAAGSLLLGSVPVMKYLEYIKQDFSEVKGQLRFISMVEGMGEEGNALINWVGEAQKEWNHYYVLPSGCADTGSFLRDILAASGRNRVYLTREKTGVCGSGFFTPRIN